MKRKQTGNTDRGTELLAAGEFAVLCDTPKSTLRYYRDEGIVIPESVGENGYGHYAPLQGLDVVSVRALENCGLTLKEIKAMRVGGASREAFHYADILEHMERERSVLQSKMAMLCEARRVAEGAEAPAAAVPSKRQESAHFLFLAYERPSTDIEYNFIHSTKMLFRLSREYLGTSPLLFGRTVGREDLLNGRYHKVKGLIVPVTEELALSGRIPPEHLWRADASDTVCAHFSGKPYSYRGPYEKLFAYIGKKGLTAAGDGVELWTGDMRPRRHGEYATLIEIPVRSGAR